MKAITLKSAKDEAIGALAASGGLIGGSILMKMASGKINPWLVSAVGLVAGYGLRLVSDNETLKDVGTGLLVAGTLDAARKAVDTFGVNVPGLSLLSENIPTLSGPNDPGGWSPTMYTPDFSDARSLRGPGALSISVPAAIGLR